MNPLPPTMLALRFEERVRLDPHTPRPQPKVGEALIRVRLAGICSTDQEIVQGYAGFVGILGHEFVGEVVHCDTAPDWVGQRVVGEINIGCGHCPRCRGGGANHCPSRRVVGIRGWDGVLAEYVCLPVANLHAVPAAVSDEAALFTEPLAAALEMIEQFHLRPTMRVTVVGDGKLGLLAAQVVALTGCRVRVVGRHPERHPLLRQWGLEPLLAHELEGARADPAEELVVECSGSPAGWELACALLAPRGTLLLKSTFHGVTPAQLGSLVVREQQVVGTRCGPFAPALRLLQRGAIKTQPLLAACLPLGAAEEAFRMAARPGVLKVAVQP